MLGAFLAGANFAAAAIGVSAAATAGAPYGNCTQAHQDGTYNIAKDDPDFSRDIDLFDTGYLDSLGLVALTTFLEDTYAFSLTGEDFFDPAFTTINGMARLLTERVRRSALGLGVPPAVPRRAHLADSIA